METARAIRLLAVFVVGVVLAMGGAMIYSVAAQSSEERPSFHRPPAYPDQSSGVSHRPEFAAGISPVTATREPEAIDSVVKVPMPPANEPSVAYVQAPATTVVRTPVPSGGLGSISQPRTAATATPVSTTGQLTSNRPSSQAVEISSTARASTIRPWTAPAGESNVAADDVPPSAGHPASAKSEPHTVTLWSGTPLIVKLAEPLSTDHVKKGRSFLASLESPIVRDGFVIAEAGSQVTGDVIESKRSGVFGRAPDLRLILVKIHTTDDQDVRIETTSWDGRDQSHRPAGGAMRNVFGAFSEAWISEAPFVKGHHNLILPENTTLQFRLAAPVSLTEHTH